jgi:phosphoribosylaminoimidazole-succinocarboxamide synthase
MAVMLETQLPNLFAKGKVRDTYDAGNGRLLMVTTDRISAFDFVLPTGIPDKGAVLTQLSAFWFQRTADIVPNHFIRLADGTAADELPFELPPEFIGRSMIVRRARRVDIECVARGYATLAGAGWDEYREKGTLCGVRMPPDLKESQQLPEPIFTPTTKAETGHDENLTYEQTEKMVGPDTANVLRVRSLALYNYGAQYARERGIIIPDTKFEFGWLDDELIVIDEVLTPDSSRFWPADSYEPGRPQPSFDKQFVRNWLIDSGWDRKPPAPELPADIVEKTSEKYREAHRRITGQELLRPA